MLHAEAHRRDHAIVEQVIADLKNGPLAHLPAGVFTANAAWTVAATIAGLTRAAATIAGLTRAAATLAGLTRAAATLAGLDHARATTATIRRRPIHVAARVVASARHLHLPAT